MPAIVKQFKGNKTVAIDPTKEYVAGFAPRAGAFGTSDGVFTLSGVAQQPGVREHPVQTYEQMTSDPKVSKDLDILTIGTLGDGVELLPAVPETDEFHDEALAITEFCQTALNGLRIPLRYTLQQMMDALVYGHKIAEIVYKTSPVKGFEGEYLIPDRIKVKRLDAVKFVVDNKGNVIGLTVSHLADDKANKSPSKNMNLTRGTNNEPLVNGHPILPREKFMVLTINGKDSDPRGQSILAPAFQAWHMKTQIWPEYFKYLLLCAIPLLVGFTPENDTAVKEILRGADGQPLVDPVTGGYIEANPVVALRDAMLQARNAEVLAVKGGTAIQEIGGQGAGTPFFKAIELFDNQIETAILLQTLATSEGVHQSRAASLTQMSVLDQLIWWLKGVVVDMLVADLLRPMVRFNFGDDALEFTPRATLGDTERREFATDSIAIAQLYKSGYLQPDQLKQTDAMLGLGIRRTVDPLHLIQQLQAAGIPIVAVPPPPTQAAQIQAGPGGGSKPAPVSPSGVSLPTGQADSQQSKLRTLNRQGATKFPAAGRVKGKINKSPKNNKFPNILNQKPVQAE
jgi:hypothetical protein